MNPRVLKRSDGKKKRRKGKQIRKGMHLIEKRPRELKDQGTPPAQTRPQAGQASILILQRRRRHPTTSSGLVRPMHQMPVATSPPARSGSSNILAQQLPALQQVSNHPQDLCRPTMLLLRPLRSNQRYLTKRTTSDRALMQAQGARCPAAK